MESKRNMLISSAIKAGNDRHIITRRAVLRSDILRIVLK
jgi:hypothetical protein